MAQKTTYANGDSLAATDYNAAMAALNSAEQVANKNAANGYVGADSAGKLALSSINASGTPSSSNYLRGDGSWTAVSGETFNPFLLMGA